ncbi:creatininase family protein [Bacteroides zoogleoformans]|uniref:creatininase family protein n=1 Tax=Bacteroides zoogleoformans TaxID=28119 RepID=UPI00248F3635|nr:creatininase family protein [Bacteroides zoogleoformans]
MKNKNHLDLSLASYGEVRDLTYDLVVLPWGATEPHNLHLPYLTDAILSHAVAVDAAEKALQLYGVRCMVLSPVTLGSQNPGQRSLKFCIHARYETQKAVLADTVASLHAQGFHKLVLINGHGGNNFKNMIRDLAVDYPDFLIASGEWFAVLSAKEYFDAPGDHADEVETSVMMHYYPELVDLSMAGPGVYKPFALSALREKVAWMPRDWGRATEDTGIGDPSLSTAEKGKRFAQAVSDKYAELFAQLARAHFPEEFY